MWHDISSDIDTQCLCESIASDFPPRQYYYRCFRYDVAKFTKLSISEPEANESFRTAFWTPVVLVNKQWASAIMGILKISNSNACPALLKTCELGLANGQTTWNDFAHLNKCSNEVFRIYLSDVRVSYHMIFQVRLTLSVGASPLQVISTTPMRLSLFSICFRKIHASFNYRSRSCWAFQNSKCTSKQRVSKRHPGNPENFKLECRSCVAENMWAWSRKRANHIKRFSSHKKLVTKYLQFCWKM